MVCKIPSYVPQATRMSRGYPSAYGLFDCHSESDGRENALISYGILQPLSPWDSKLSGAFPSFSFPCIHQFEPESVDEGPQYGIAFYHLLKDHLRRVLHQEEVGDVQSGFTLCTGRAIPAWLRC